MNTRFYKQQLLDSFVTQREQGRFWLVWFVVLPLVPLIAYMCLGYLRILPSTDLIPRHIYIVLGMTCWLLFSESLTRPTQTLTSRRGYFIRQEISLTALLTAWVPERLLVLALQVCFCLGVSYFYVHYSVLEAGTFLLLLASGCGLFTALGILVALVTLISPSFGKLVETANRFLLFLSAVIFPLPDSATLTLLKLANPYHLFIDNARLGLLGQPVDWLHLGYWCAGVALVMLVLRGRIRAVAPDIREYLQ